MRLFLILALILMVPLTAYCEKPPKPKTTLLGENKVEVVPYVEATDKDGNKVWVLDEKQKQESGIAGVMASIQRYEQEKAALQDPEIIAERVANIDKQLEILYEMRDKLQEQFNP